LIIQRAVEDEFDAWLGRARWLIKAVEQCWPGECPTFCV
jgi:hypothetical protein